MVPGEELPYSLFRSADGPCQRDFRQIVLKNGRDVIVIRLSNGLLSLDDFHRVGDSSGKAIARLVQCFAGKLYIALGDAYFAICEVQIDESVANILIDAAANVFKFGLALFEHR